MQRILVRSMIAVMMLSSLISAQSFAPGVKAGFDLATYYGDDVIENKSLIGGFTGGFFLRFNLSDFIGIQPEVLYAQKGTDYETTSNGDEFILKDRFHYIEIPIQCMIYLPAGNTLSPYLSVGPYGGALIEAKRKEYLDGEERYKTVITNAFNRMDFGISAGFGTVFNLDEGDFVLDCRFNIGLLSIDDASEDKADVKNISFAVTLGYAFGLPTLVGHRSANIQKADVSYMRFIGNIEGVSVEVDGGPRFEIKSSETNYETTPGKHVVKAYRGNQQIMHREMYIGNHETKEVTVQ